MSTQADQLAAYMTASEGAGALSADYLSLSARRAAGLTVGLGLLSEEQAAIRMAEATGLPLWHGGGVEDPPSGLIATLGLAFLRHHSLFPIEEDEESIVLVSAEPLDHFAFDVLRLVTGKACRVHVATGRQVEQLLDHQEELERLESEGAAGPAIEDIDRLREIAANAPVVRYVDRLIDDALSRGASDIHIEPHEGSADVRLRIDGILIPVTPPASENALAVVSRIKILAELDIAERRLPQDGRMRVRSQGRLVDFRVASSPTAHGENVVMRLLDRSAVQLKLDALGFDPCLSRPFETALDRPNGIVLVTGPTGSGKTTTLYAGLTRLNTRDRKILTVEDPVEYQIEGLQQTQVDPRIGRSFAATLRSFLRLDPDIIMVGEIRDQETASIAVQASLTGHLVLSTLHTNSAAGAIGRLIDMGVDAFLLASTLKLVVAQRLVRILCPACKQADPGLDVYAFDGSRVDGAYCRPVGCAQCHDTGYQGRQIIGEAIEINRSLEQALTRRRDSADIMALAIENGTRPMLDHGIALAQAGVTSMAEVWRVTARADL